MGKRSSFDRERDDFYPTPWDAVAPLLPQLAERTRFVEPCAGDGSLMVHLEQAGHKCALAGDLVPRNGHIEELDARALKVPKALYDVFITNPPWDRRALHPIIYNLSDQGPAWLLFDFDWLATKQAAPLLPRLREIIIIGRVKWIPGSENTGMDNAAWYLFDHPEPYWPAPLVKIWPNAAIPEPIPLLETLR